ncbi:MAG: MFS transporter [Stellaceae bacterium]
MTLALEPPAQAAPAPARAAGVRAGRALDGLNFFIANFQTGFGPFVAIYLTSVGWTQGEIGLALSVGTMTAVAGQLPAGALVDAVRDKRRIAALALVAIIASALLVAAWPVLLPIFVAEALHAFASGVLNPAIAAISLMLVEESQFGERLGRNARYAAIGNAIGAGLMGACGYWLSGRAVFVLTALLGAAALAALQAIRQSDLGLTPRANAVRSRESVTIPAARRPPWRRWRLPLWRVGQSPRAATRGVGQTWRVFADPRLLVFGVCAALFQLANAALLPLAAGLVTKRAGAEAPLLIAASIIGPQLVTALLAPRAGRAAEHWGRRPVLILGFAALPLRALLFAGFANPDLLMAFQLLDGIDAAAFGVLLPLVVADIAGAGGHYTLSLGLVGLFVGLGATLSTTAAGFAADQFGAGVAFLMLSGVGVVATLLVWALMPETRPAATGRAALSPLARAFRRPARSP